MYSRYYGSSKGEVHLPENYSGCAFPRDAVGKSPAAPPVPPHYDPPPTKKPLTDPPSAASESPADPPETQAEPYAKEPSTPPAPPSLSVPLGMDFDQLLILGLILLLLHGGEDSEIVLWLVLLLFC